MRKILMVKGKHCLRYQVGGGRKGGEGEPHQSLEGGVAWCFGHHDRPFAERPIFGTVRCMTMKGLEGKFDMVRYRTRVRSKCVAAVKDEPRLRDLLPDACFDPVTSSGSATRGTGKRSSAAPPSRDIRGFFSAASTAPPAEKRPRFSSPLSSNSTGASAAGSAAGR